jgi:hypothetical protein
MEPIVKKLRVVDEDTLVEMGTDTNPSHSEEYRRGFRRVYLTGRKFSIHRSFSVTENISVLAKEAKPNTDGNYTLDNFETHIQEAKGSKVWVETEIDLDKNETFAVKMFDQYVTPNFTLETPTYDNRGIEFKPNEIFELVSSQDPNRSNRIFYWRLKSGEFIEKLTVILEERQTEATTKSSKIEGRYFDGDLTLGFLSVDWLHISTHYDRITRNATLCVGATKEVLDQLVTAITSHNVEEIRFSIQLNTFFIDNTFFLPAEEIITAYLESFVVRSPQYRTEPAELNSDNAEEIEETVKYKEIVAEISKEKEEATAKLEGLFNELTNTKRTLKTITFAFRAAFVISALLLCLYLLK